jgi:hypothetical protein
MFMGFFYDFRPVELGLFSAWRLEDDDDIDAVIRRRNGRFTKIRIKARTRIVVGLSSGSSAASRTTGPTLLVALGARLQAA